jgi:pyruvyltransferase
VVGASPSRSHAGRRRGDPSHPSPDRTGSIGSSRTRLMTLTCELGLPMGLARLASRLGRRTASAAVSSACSYPSVELVSWRPSTGARNFGDHLSRVVAAAVAAERGLTFEDEVTEHRRLLAIGSILHLSATGDAIWGTGINGKIPLEEIKAERLAIYAVRGPKTAATLRELGFTVPEVFGDPALLVPRYFGKRFTITTTRDYIFIPNLNDLQEHRFAPNLVSPLMGWNRCIEEICRSKLVIASSLHGIILAEAFGIPARYVRLSEIESRFKYDDYAQGTGRADLTPAYSIEEARDMGGLAPIHFDADALIAAFPYDLWR